MRTGSSLIHVDTALLCVILCASVSGLHGIERSEISDAQFDPVTDLLSLHYDHAPDRDDGDSAAADRTMLEVEFGKRWIEEHVVPVSGTYGRNAASFNPASDAVMDAVWNDVGGWLAAHDRPEESRVTLARRWMRVLRSGGDVWVKEGGQSDLTADVISIVRRYAPNVDMHSRVHVVQHSDWNEDQASPAALDYVKMHIDYIRIRDANAYLNAEGGNAAFEAAARNHPAFGRIWRAAFMYYDPGVRLDFSDTGELMRILNLGEIDFEEFRARFLEGG